MVTQKLVNLVAMVVRFVWRRPLLALTLLLLAFLLYHCLGADKGMHIQGSICPLGIPTCP